MAKFDIHQAITDQIIAHIESGNLTWSRGWVMSRPRSLRQEYSGINRFILSMTKTVKGYESDYWLTFKDVERLEGKVNKGAKSEMVVYYTMFKREDKDTGEIVEIPMLRYYRVFNLDQTSLKGQIKNEEVTSFTHDQTVACADKLMSGFDCEITTGSDNACYIPSLDVIRIPEASKFKELGEFYQTAFHEMVHATGHPKRLNRFEVAGAHKFGSIDYSKEELVAELGASYLMADCQLTQAAIVKNSAAYIQGWLKVLKSDKKFIFSAASQAEKAAGYIKKGTK